MELSQKAAVHTRVMIRQLVTRTMALQQRCARLHCVADLCVVPLGGESARVGDTVKKAVALLHSNPALKTLTHGYGTNIEGEVDDVLAAIKSVHEELHGAGVPRISSTIKLGTRTDKHSSIEHKLSRVADAIRKPP